MCYGWVMVGTTGEERETGNILQLEIFYNLGDCRLALRDIRKGNYHFSQTRRKEKTCNLSFLFEFLHVLECFFNWLFLLNIHSVLRCTIAHTHAVSAVDCKCWGEKECVERHRFALWSFGLLSWCRHVAVVQTWQVLGPHLSHVASGL